MKISLHTLQYKQSAAISYRKENQNAINKNKLAASGQFDSISIHSDLNSVKEQDFASVLSRSLSREIASSTASQEKVQSLADQVASGTYRPDAYAIASRILLEV